MLREIVSNEWFTILIITSIAIVAMVKLLFTPRFNNFVTLIGNSKYLKIHSREQKFFEFFDGMLFLNLVISTTLFIMLVIKNHFDAHEITLEFFFKISIGIGALFLIKILVERLLGSLFEIDDLINAYLFQKISYRNYLGLILIPVNIILIYTISLSKIVIYIIIILLFIVNLIGIITTIRNHQKLLINNFFYFILYLCALEISPYIILYKLFIK